MPVNEVSWAVNGGNPALPSPNIFDDPIEPCLDGPTGFVFGDNYLIIPSRDNDHLNGVSTFDLVLINKHILGLQPLNSPYTLLAADANNSRSITTFDIVELRKLILGIYSELPNHTSWGFIPKSFVFPNPNNPFQTATPKSVKYNQALAGGGDFVGYKVGDVNGNASSCNYLVTPETRSAVPILTDDRLLQAGETVRLAWRLPAGAPLPAGLQFSLYFDPEELDIAGLALGPGSGQPASANGFYAQPEPGILNFSWNAESGAAVATGDALIYLDVRARQAVQLSKAIRFDQSRLRAELYTGGGETQALSLAFLPAPASGETQIFPATPNPSTGSVFIPVQLVQPAAVRIAVYDLSGRPVYVAENEQAAGFQRLEIPAAALAGLRGMLVYRVQVGQVISCGKIAI